MKFFVACLAGVLFFLWLVIPFIGKELYEEGAISERLFGRMVGIALVCLTFSIILGVTASCMYDKIDKTKEIKEKKGG